MATLGTFASGQVLTAAELNAIGTFTAYTPSILASTTNPTASVTTGYYTKLNDLVIGFAEVGNFSASGSGTIYITTPTNIDQDDFWTAGHGHVADGSTRYPITAMKSSSGANRLFFVATSSNATVTHNTPFTLSTGDYFRISFQYRSA